MIERFLEALMLNILGAALFYPLAVAVTSLKLGTCRARR
jgi:hypothetical protein